METISPKENSVKWHWKPQRVGEEIPVRGKFAQVNTQLANERTHLAYLRTSLALMSFGITLNRFSIFLRENQAHPSAHDTLLQTEFVGLGMVMVGIFILVWGLYRFQQNAKGIEKGYYTPPTRGMWILTVTVLLLGASMTVWMFLNRG